MVKSVGEMFERFIRQTEDELDAQAIQDALREYQDGGTISLDQLKDELDL